jgi:AcrR family transcriptional regulator
MTDTHLDLPTGRPMRADARRNHEKLVAAAREVFAAEGTAAPLEEVASRAGVGIGTLYRRFPTRQALLEAVYLEEVQAIAAAAQELEELEPWEALTRWLHRYVGFAATKRALTEALLEAAPDSDVLLACRTAILDAGDGLVQRAQAAGVVRPDVGFSDVGRMISGIAVVPTVDDEQKRRLVDLALDGLRYRAAG